MSVTRGELVVSLLAEGTLQSDNSVVVRTGRAPGQLTGIATDGTVLRAGDAFCRIEARDLMRKQTDAELAAKQANEEIERSRDNAQQQYENEQRMLDQAEKDYQVWLDSTAMTTKQAEDQLAFDRAEAERLRLESDRSQRMAAKGYQAGAEAEVAKAAYDAQQFKVAQSEKDLELNHRQIAAQRRQRESMVAAARRRTQISREHIQERVHHAQQRAEVAAKELETVKAALADTVIVAPAAGTVSLFSTWQGGERRSWREGDQVSSGTPLGSISGSENMSVRCRIKENNIAAVRKGQEAEIEFQSLAGKNFSGVVSSVGTVAREVWIWEDPTAEANERVFDVVVKVKQTRADGLKPGLNAKARIIVKRLPNVLSVPLDAVFERAGKSLVYVKQGDGFVKRDVETGERSDAAIEVRSGLSEGEVIALSDPTRYPTKPTEKSG
jgi:RND family efflux transporter MFP subunit